MLVVVVLVAFVVSMEVVVCSNCGDLWRINFIPLLHLDDYIAMNIISTIIAIMVFTSISTGLKIIFMKPIIMAKKSTNA